MPRSVAVLHRTGDAVRAVLADTSGQRPRVTAWREFTAADTTVLERWLDDAGPDEVIGILPASAVICRTCTLPSAAPEALAQALALQAEAHMHAAAPQHRMVMAALPGATGETARSGIICAWPERAAPALPETSRPISWCPDVAAIAAILNGERPADPLVWVDGADGSIALALSHADGATFRCARASVESPASWRQSACRVLAETAIAVNHTGAFTESLVGAMERTLAALPAHGAALIGPDETIARVRDRLAGTADAGWWHDYGVAAGAVLARTGELAPLTTLERDAPVLHPSRFQQITERFARPAYAARIVAVCVAVMLLAPLASARLRLALVQARLPEIEAEKRAADQIENRLAVYDALERESWPMTKLLADIACNTPEGIELDQIRIRHGNDIQMTGNSKGNDGVSAQGLIAQMQSNFRTSGVFTNISPNYEPDNFGGYDLTLTATVAAPYRKFGYPIERDFAAVTLAERLYGEGIPRETTQAAPAVETTLDEPPAMTEIVPADVDDNEAGAPPFAGSGSRPPRGSITFDPMRGGGGDPGASRSNPSDRAGSNTTLPPSADIPEPLTPLQVNTMSVAALKEAYARFAIARKYARGDEELDERLKADFALIRDRLRVLSDDDDDDDDEGESTP